MMMLNQPTTNITPQTPVVPPTPQALPTDLGYGGVTMNYNVNSQVPMPQFNPMNTAAGFAQPVMPNWNGFNQAGMLQPNMMASVNPAMYGMQGNMMNPMMNPMLMQQQAMMMNMPYGFMMPQPQFVPTPQAPLPPNGVLQTRNIPESSATKVDKVLQALNEDKDASKLLQLARLGKINLTVGNTDTVQQQERLTKAGVSDAVVFDPDRMSIVISDKLIGTVSERDLAKYIAKGLTLGLTMAHNSSGRTTSLERQMTAEWLGRNIANRFTPEGEPKLATTQQEIVNWAKARWVGVNIRPNDTTVEYLNNVGINLESWIEPSANELGKQTRTQLRSTQNVASSLKQSVKDRIREGQQTFVNAFDMLTSPTNQPDIGRFQIQ
ncbi:MAG: hypothetical protein ACKO34_03825 [Vampirovibrionales bacterium]